MIKMQNAVPLSTVVSQENVVPDRPPHRSLACSRDATRAATCRTLLLAMSVVMPTAVHAETNDGPLALQLASDRADVIGWVGLEGDLGLADLGGAVELIVGGANFPLAVLARAGVLSYGDLLGTWRGLAWYAEPGLALTGELGRWRLSARGTFGVGHLEARSCPLLGTTCTESPSRFATTGTVSLQVLAQSNPRGVYAGASLGVRKLSDDVRPLVGLHAGLAF